MTQSCQFATNFSLGLWVPAPVRNCALGGDDSGRDKAR